MLVGLVNSGILNLEQTTGMIMGSNIGTTLTAWIPSLAGINSSSVLLSMLKPENFSPVTVSYTHLDVYTRQSILFCPPHQE